jgi:hypothetical protein
MARASFIPTEHGLAQAASPRRIVLASERERGPGYILERRLKLWHWMTWASGGPIGARARSGWSLRRSRATVAIQDALDDYSLFPWSKS